MCLKLTMSSTIFKSIFKLYLTSHWGNSPIIVSSILSLTLTETYINYKLCSMFQLILNRYTWASNLHVLNLNSYNLGLHLPTSRQQVVFALLVPSCQQVWNKLLTTCNKLVDIIRLVARLFQQVRYCHDLTILLYNLVSSTLKHSCFVITASDLLQQLVTSLIMPSSLLQPTGC
jgi:hypothetical protein